MGFESKYIWMDGKLVEFEKATVHFLSSTLHYGIGAFEGIRCYDTPNGPAIFRLKEHMRRLLESALIVGLQNMPYTAEELIEAARLTVRANGFKQCYVRPLVYLGDSITTMNTDQCGVNVGIAAWDWGSYLGDAAIEAGIRANVSSYTRHHINVGMTKAKVTGNYANSSLAKTESIRLGFDEAIMLDPQGYVAECSGENIFLVRNGKIITPPLATILDGITRDTVFILAQDEGIDIREAPISRDQLYAAEEVFVTGTAAELIAIREIDFRKIGAGKMGPVTRKLQTVFQSVIHGNHPRSKDWLTYVN
jgi:branched-chain amino acid aminotransferase